MGTEIFSREPKEPFFGRGHLLIRVLCWEDGQGTEGTDFVGQGNQWEPKYIRGKFKELFMGKGAVI